MNMVGLLLWTCLFVSAQAMLKYHMLTPRKGKEVIAPASDGDGFSLDLLWVDVHIPSNDWGLSAWLFIGAAIDTARLMQVHVLPGLDFYFYWPAAGTPTFNVGGVDHFDPTAPTTRESGKWFHAAMGSYNGDSQGVVTLKGNPTQLIIQWAEEVKLRKVSTLMGPEGDSNFSVRAM